MSRINFFYLHQNADQENEQRRRLELAAQNANKTNENVIKKNKINQKKQQVIHLHEIMIQQITSFCTKDSIKRKKIGVL